MPVKDIISNLSLDEKIKLLTGKNFWYLRDIPAFDLKSIMLTDGPHGLRKQAGNPEQANLSSAVAATCFPTASCLASSWDKDLLYDVGKALGQACLAEDVSVLLGPGMNIKRHPLCGRNFEYFSEDPYVSGKLGSAMVKGIQSQGIGACVKHFVANNQEDHRMTIDAIIDERTLRELYLKSFEIAVKESKPWAVMSAYNQVNGTYVSEDKFLLTDILRKEWSYQGLVVTDWGANNDPVEAIKHGLNLEMPANHHASSKQIRKAVKKGRLSEQSIDMALEKNIELIEKANQKFKVESKHLDLMAQHMLARRAARESMVLLKNEQDILPLHTDTRVALIGQLAKKPRYQGAGSSLVNPTYIDSAYDAFKDVLRDHLSFAEGYDLNHDSVNDDLLDQAIDVCQTSDVIFLMLGLPDRYESEGFDREHLDLPYGQIYILEKLMKLNKPMIVSLSNGGPVLMPWRHDVQAIIEQYLAGQASGSALADIVFGRVSPMGYLAETIPNHLDDIPTNQNFPGHPKQVQYREGLFVGYRAYDHLDIEPAYPFGFGLSYCKIEYKDISLYHDIEHKRIIIKGQVINQGDYDIKVLVQVYVSKEKSLVYRPKQALIRFEKYFVKAHSSAPFNFEIQEKDLQIFQDTYVLEEGTYTFKVAKSSRDVVYEDRVYIQSKDHVNDDLAHGYKDLKPRQIIDDCMFQTLLGKPIPKARSIKPYHMNSTMQDIKNTWLGKIMYRIINKQLRQIMGDKDDKNDKMIGKMIEEMPIRTLVNYSQGKLSHRRAQGLIDLLNHKFFRGLFKVIV